MRATDTQDRDAGFSLAEVAVALLLAGLALGGVAQLVVTATKSLEAARDQTVTVATALAKAEQLRALTWSWDALGLPVSDGVSDLSGNVPTGGGTGLGPSPPDSLERDAIGFVDYLTRDGIWIGAGPVVPPSAAYVRRWRIVPLAADPIESRLVQVLVTTRARAALGAPAAHRPLPGDSRLVFVVTRKVR